MWAATLMRGELWWCPLCGKGREHARGNLRAGDFAAVTGRAQGAAGVRGFGLRVWRRRYGTE